jgi:hypothetical protein
VCGNRWFVETAATPAPGRRCRLSGACVWGSSNGTASRRSCCQAANASLLAGGGARYDQAMSGVPADLPPSSAVVLTNPDEDASPEAFRAFIDELLAGPEPELESVDAAAALRAVRADTQA